ncbi:MAG: hypothetical protein QMC06_02350, partial [Gammaproteobacteria bacterium]
MNKISREQLIKTLIATSFILPGYLGFSVLATAQDGSAGASSYSQPDGVAAASYSAPAPADTSIQSNNEDQLLSNTHQLIEGSLRSGEGYFSADGDRFIYQSETV